MIPLLNPLSIVPVPPTKRKPTHDEIARVAHQLYLEQGSQPGYELDDWLRAERIVTEQISREERNQALSRQDASAASPNSSSSPFRKPAAASREFKAVEAPTATTSQKVVALPSAHSIQSFRAPQFGLTPSLSKWSPYFQRNSQE